MDEAILSGTMIYTDIDAERIFSPQADFYRKMIHELLRGKDLNELISYGHSLLLNPPHLIVGSTLVCSPPDSQFANSSFLDMLRMNSPECHEVLYLVTKADFIQKLHDSSTPILVDCKHLGIRLIICKIQYGEETVATLMLPESEQKFGENDILYMHVLSTFISEELSKGERFETNICSILFKGHFKALLERQEFEETDRTWLNMLLRGEQSSQLRICVIKAKEENHASLEKELNELYFCRTIVYKGNLIVLATIGKHSQDRRLYETLCSCAQEYYLQCGVSEMFKDPSRILLYYRQAFCTLELGERQGANDCCYLYEDKKIDTVLFDASHCIGISKYSYGVFDFINSDDSKNDTELYKTLNYYLHEGANKNIVSQKLGIHKNTLSFRLRCIERDYGVDFDKDDGLYRMMLFEKLWDLNRNNKLGGDGQ